LPSASASPYTQRVDAADKAFCTAASPRADDLMRLKIPSMSYRTSRTDPSIQARRGNLFWVQAL
jgi:hypothetical protein